MDIPGIVEVTNMRCNQRNMKASYSRYAKRDFRQAMASVRIEIILIGAMHFTPGC